MWVFEHLKQLWMDIWQHIHTVTTTELSPDLGELAEIIDDVKRWKNNNVFKSV